MSEDKVTVDMSHEEIREKIIHLLRIYPIISPTMLQGGLGPYIKPRVWRPVLEQLVQDGIVVQTQETILSPGGRYNVHNKISLLGTETSLNSDDKV